MSELRPKKRYSVAKQIALVGIAAAAVECGKFALSFLPNIEVVSILIAVFGYVFGYSGVIIALVFVSIEPLIWGFGSWVVTYFIYWPTLALVFCLLGRAKIGSRRIATGVAMVMTLLFGILSSIINVLILMGATEHFLQNLLLYYARGIVFYAVQIACNTVLFFTLFEFLTQKLGIIKRRMSL